MGAAESSGGATGTGPLDEITSSGKLGALSMRWIPTETFPRVGSGGGNSLARDALCGPVAAAAASGDKSQRKREVLAKARGLLQQKLLQLCVEGDHMTAILAEVEDLASRLPKDGMTMEDAVALERLVALSRFNQHLYLDQKSSQATGFFFRQSNSEDDES